MRRWDGEFWGSLRVVVGFFFVCGLGGYYKGKGSYIYTKKVLRI